MKKIKYLSDPNLADNEVKTMILLNSIINGQDYISQTNEEIGNMICKSSGATAKILFHLAKKGYVKSVNHNVKRKLYILK